MVTFEFTPQVKVKLKYNFSVSFCVFRALITPLIVYIYNQYLA